eukprot:TRINITY_DN24537_c0_g1_i1.p1 TRINITY_DN24537_c0_g1~~TRINITY_DN24537_c0_g1_i1.p1  ORF type:complete len:107 (-),score=9.04 TRINITY_DN24537_c0_g1_i1:37-357(-)
MFSWAAPRMSVLVGLGTVAAAVAYSKTKNNTWLYGIAAFAGILPYTLFAMGPTNTYLSKTLKESGEADLKDSEKPTVTERLKKWVGLHRGRVLFGVAAAALFWVAK